MLSRTIALIRISRPARAIRATPLLPKRVSSAPLAVRRITAPRGVPAAVRSVPATSVVPDGPCRIAVGADPGRGLPGPERDLHDPGAVPAGSGTPVGRGPGRP